MLFRSGSARWSSSFAGRMGIGNTSNAVALTIKPTALYGSNSSGTVDNAIAIQNIFGTNVLLIDTSGIFKTNVRTTLNLISDSYGLFGITAPRTDFFGGTQTPNIQVEKNSALSMISAIANANDATSTGRLLLAKSRGTTSGAVTKLQSGDRFGVIDFLGADGTNLKVSAQIFAFVDGGEAGSASQGLVSRFSWYTTAPASATSEKMRLTKYGNLLIGSTTDTTTAKLVVKNDAIMANLFYGINSRGTNVAKIDSIGKGTFNGSVTALLKSNMDSLAVAKQIYMIAVSSDSTTVATGGLYIDASGFVRRKY